MSVIEAARSRGVRKSTETTSGAVKLTTPGMSGVAQFSSAVFHLMLADVDVPVFETSKANQVNALVEFGHLT